MDSSRVIASISTAIDSLQLRMKTTIPELAVYLMKVMHKLRVMRTLVLCSTKLGSQVHLGPGDNNDDSEKSLQSQKHRTKKMKKGQESLLVRIENIIGRIFDGNDLLYGVGEDLSTIFEEEMDKWYYFQQYKSSPVANLIKDIVDSVLENFEDFLSSYDHEGIRRLIDPWKDISFIINFIHFGALFGAEHQKFEDLFTCFEALAISAAHLTLHLSLGTSKVSESMIARLSLKMKPFEKPFLHETYTLTLGILKSSREIYVPTLDLENLALFLQSNLLEMLQSDMARGDPLKDKFQALYQGLRSLVIMLDMQPSMSDGRIRDIIGAAIFDAGIIACSLHQKDLMMDLELHNFLENIKVIRTEVLSSNSPKASVLSFLDFFLDDYLMKVNSCKVDSDTLSYLPKIQESLSFLRSFMRKLAELRNEKEDLHQDVWNVSVEVAYKIEFLIDQLVLGDILDSFSASFNSTTEYIMIIKTESMKIFDESSQKIGVHNVTWSSTIQVPSQSSHPTADEVVGFEAERTSIIDRLTRGPKKLQVVAIVGMAGSGKTTLATKVYNHPPVGYHFHVSAWCSISQVFDRRKVLLELLNQIQPCEISAMNEDDLSQQLWRSLRRRRYLIFVDDVWDAEAFILLKGSLPDDSNQSRILLTSRHGDVVPGDKPLFLPQLTRKESFELLRRKLFPLLKDWPSSLHEFGMEIVEYCKGLPLTIVIVVGLLRTTQQEDWKKVLESLRSGIISTADQCMNTIELSYKHLPDHLKPCFLSFSAFPEDHEVSVKRLIWQWIAEGFVQKNESRSLEEVATQYLEDLIGRSLVMSSKETTTGGVKTCRIHNLLHDFCLRKANEDNFLHLLNVYGDGGLNCFDEPGNVQRLSIQSKPEHFQKSKICCPRLRSLLFFHPTEWEKNLDMSFIFRIFKLLRVLGMDQIELTELPTELGLLVQLRYLAIQFPLSIPSSIGNLYNLETLIILVPNMVTLPSTVWNLRKLRHLHSVHKYYGSGKIKIPSHNLHSSCDLLELESLSTLYSMYWREMEMQLRKFPNIRQLKCKLHAFEDGKIMEFSFLSQLESLSLTFTCRLRKPKHGFMASYQGTVSLSEFEFIFPESIKKLTLSGCELPRSS